jgi:hypothetical protein
MKPQREEKAERVTDPTRVDFDCGHKLDPRVTIGPLLYCHACDAFRLPQDQKK